MSNGARRRAIARRARTALAAGLLLALGACLRVESYFFAGEPIDRYRWDEAAPELDGDLSDPHPSRVPPEAREEGFAALEDGTPIHWVLARREGARATILFSHGNGPHLGRAWDRVERLWELGFHVLTYDYPGYGRSGGRASEAGIYASIDRVHDEVLPALRDVDAGALIVYGHSLGAAAAFHLAARTAGGARAPLALVAESAWCSIEEMIHDGAFLDLPRELLSHLELDNCARMAELGPGVPVLLLHGTRDTTTPPRQARLLAARASGPATLVWIEGAGHSDLPNVAGGSYDRALSELVARGP